jgi:hypothetical protein
MRVTNEASGSLCSYVDLEALFPARHQLREIRQVVNDALASMDCEFATLYTDFGRPSIASERLAPRPMAGSSSADALHRQGSTDGSGPIT